MSLRRLPLWILVFMSLLPGLAQAGGPPPMYVLVDRVLVTEFPQTPPRIQIWGSFTRTSVPQPVKLNPPEHGYLHLEAPQDGSSDFRVEWQKWQSAAGTGKIVAVGSCYVAGAFHQYPIHSAHEPVGEPDGVYETGQLEQQGSLFIADSLAEAPDVGGAIVALRNFARARGDRESSPGAEPLVVHEWGTFTTFAGSNGIHLDFRPLAQEEGDLPSFVLDRSNAQGSIFLKKQLRGRVRMETPVLFFYTSRERDVEVSVGFPQGLITEFYPPVRAIEPAFDAEAARTVGEPVGNSRIDWGTVHLIPPHQLEPAVEQSTVRQAVAAITRQALLPAPGNFPHYYEARHTDAAFVHWRDTDGFSTDHFEKFLFYRGVGNFSLPIQVTAASDGKVSVANQGAQPIPTAFLVEVVDQQLRFALLPSVAAGTVSSFPPLKNVSVEELTTSLQQELVAAGLYAAEASAMLRSWSSSWFGEPGTRVFYLVPESLTHQLLPLQIKPAPSQTVRVLVARSELMTPALEQRLLKVLQQSAEEVAALQRAAAARPDQVAPELPIPAPLLQLGRLAEPTLVRLAQLTDNSQVRAEIARIQERLAATRLAATP